jgi:hypothetical protein
VLGLSRPDRHWRFQITRNRHLDLPLVARICNNPAIVDRVAQLFGSDLILWRTQFFLQIGKPSEGLGDNCVLILPGTHGMTTEQICREHGLGLREGRESNNQGSPQFSGTPRPSGAVKHMPLEPGEFFIFNEALVHASSESPNPSNTRVAMGMRVTVPGVKVLPLAFSDTLPKVHRCALLRGNNQPSLNELLPWPG